MHGVRKYFWDESYLIKVYVDGVVQRCISEMEMMSILKACHYSPIGGHHSGTCITHKILQCGFYWPLIYKDTHDFSKACDQC